MNTETSFMYTGRLHGLVTALVVMLVLRVHWAHAYNPQPLSDDIVLPMPNNKEMVFRAVCIGEGSGVYAWKRFRVGDPAGGYKETPTGTALGGAFQISQRDGKDWCYLIGKYEVTEDQYGQFVADQEEYRNSDFPVRNISWFEAEDFIRAYNEWLYANTREEIPEHGGIPGYLRLPTEIEWEFAARGGSAVDSGEFDRKTPYPSERIMEYEWFSGPTSSHNKVKKAGLLKPNVLGIHDMLGNISEMTQTLYQVEYYQGRSGGFVGKGGHYFTDGKQLRSSMRSEQEFYTLDSKTKTVSPGKKETLGFRVLLSSLVFPNREVSAQMDDEWEAYRRGIAQSMPAAVSTGATSNKTQISGMDAAEHLKRLRSELSQSGWVSESIDQELELLGVALETIQFTISQAEQDSAFAWIKIGSEQAFFMQKEARKLPILEMLLKTAETAGRTEMVERYRERAQEIRLNIDQAMTSYSESVRQLGSVSNTGIDQGLERYKQFLLARKAERQLELIPTVHRHVGEYVQTKRTDEEKWRDEFLKQHNR